MDSRDRRKNKKRELSGKRPGKDIKGWVIPAACILGSIALYILLTGMEEKQDIIAAEGRINREGYGGEEKECQILVEGLAEEEVPVTIRVGALNYSREKAETAFENLMGTMEKRIRGENPSLMEVRSDLVLPTKTEGVRLRWSSSDSDVLDSSGKLRKEVKTEQMIILAVELSARDYHQTYEIPIRVLPPERDEKEQQLAEFLEELERQEQTQQEQPWLTLPDSFEGKRLRYRSGEDKGYRSVILIGILLAVLLAFRGQSEEKQKNQKREKELLLDYADLLSKIVVLTGAGLTIRNAWERIVSDYEEALKEGRKKKRAAYEEMRQTCHQLQSGMTESEAYREFGRRYRLQPYLKLSGLLEQNRKTGTKNMKTLLQAEMADALEQRKNLARRLGEEAGTKLLMPLFLMLGIVMVMIMVPAMMTMG